MDNLNSLYMHGLLTPPASSSGPVQNQTQTVNQAVLQNSYTRPTDWQAMPSVVTGDKKIVALVAVYPHSSNVCRVTCGSSTTWDVDWGDGTVKTGNASGTPSYHGYTYSTLPGPICSRGYKTVVVTITPASGQSITNVDFSQAYGTSPASTRYTPWLDIIICSAQLTNLGLNGSGNYPLESITIIDHGLTSFNSKFSGLSSLRYANLNCTNITDMSSVFSGCSSLTDVILTDTSAVKLFNSCFQGCTSMTTAPSLDTSACSDFGNMFNACSALTTVPAYNLVAATTCAGMFYYCYGLTALPLFTMPGTVEFTGTITSGGFDITSPSSLVGIAAGQMLYGTGMPPGVKIQSVNRITNTITITPYGAGTSGTYDFSAVSYADCSNMFNACQSVVSVPALDTSHVLIATGMFQWCSALTHFSSAFDFSSCNSLSSAFANCNALTTAPQITFPTPGTFTGTQSSGSNQINSCSSTAWAFLGRVIWGQLTVSPSAPLYLGGPSAGITQFHSTQLILAGIVPSNTSGTFTYTYGAFDCTSMFATCGSLTSVPAYDLTGAYACNNMFLNCVSLRESPAFTISNTNVGYLWTDCTSMFSGCTGLHTANLFNTSRVVCTTNMFFNCAALISVPEFDLSFARSTSYMFSGCKALSSVPQFDFSSSANISYMFQNCIALTSIPEFGMPVFCTTTIIATASGRLTLTDVLLPTGCHPGTTVVSGSSITYATVASTTGAPGMSGGTINLASTVSISGGSISITLTPPAVNAANMFYGCTSLTSIPLLNTAYLTNVTQMFYGCYSLSSLPALDFSSAITMTGIFYGCQSLTAIPSFTMPTAFPIAVSYANSTTLMLTAGYPAAGLKFGQIITVYSPNDPVLPGGTVTIAAFTSTTITVSSTVIYTGSTTVTVGCVTCGQMFYNCRSLVAVAALDTSSVMDFSNWFYNCQALMHGPVLTTSRGLNFGSMFYNCYSLISAADYDMSEARDAAGMFYNCYNLSQAPNLTLPSILTYTGTATSGNATLTSVVGGKGTTSGINVAASVSGSNVQGTGATVSSFTTNTVVMSTTASASGVFTFTVGYVSCSNMFYGCRALTVVPSLHLDRVVNIANMFINCVSLSKVSLINVTQVLPANLGTVFSGCRALGSIEMTGLKSTFGVPSCSLSELDLVSFFNQLDTTNTSPVRTITVTGNWGVAGFTVNCNMTAGSNVLTAISSTAGVAVGMSVLSTSLSTSVETWVTSFTETTITMSSNALSNMTGTTVVIGALTGGSANGTHTINSNVITGITDTSRCRVGQTITSGYLPGGTTIVSWVASTSITVSANSTASNATPTYWGERAIARLKNYTVTF